MPGYAIDEDLLRTLPHDRKVGEKHVNGRVP
jgi:hypothetical protein